MELVTRVVHLIGSQIHGTRAGGFDSTRHRGRQKQTRAHGPGSTSQQAATIDGGVDPQLTELYSNLEMPSGSNLATVRTAWKRLLRKYHPDLHSKDPEKRTNADEPEKRLKQCLRTDCESGGRGRKQTGEVNMSENLDLVKGYLLDIDLNIVSEDETEELVVVEDEENGIRNLVIDCEPPIVILEQLIMDAPKVPGEFFKRLLQMNRTMVHGAFVLDDEDGRRVIFRDTLQLENLDRNELEGSIRSLELALAENGTELLEYITDSRMGADR